MRISIATLFCIVLASCGGGGSSSSSSTVTSKFIDSAVAGLTYVSSPSGLTGTTDSSGNFSWQSGDTTTFYIGGSSGVAIASITPVSGSSVFVGTLPNYDSVALILLSLDTGSSSTYMDLSGISDISSVKTSLETFLSSNSIDSTILTAARTAATTLNSGISLKNGTVPTKSTLYTHISSSVTTLTNPTSNPNASLTNKPYFQYEMTDTGTYQGEILSGFLYGVSSNSFRSYSSDNTYRVYSNASDITFSDAVTSTLTSLTVTDNFSNSTSTVSCPIRSTIKSFTSTSFIEITEQNYTGAGSCETKTLTSYRYLMDDGFSLSSLAGKTLSLSQACGTSTNTFSLTFASNGSYSLSGTICSVKQQNSLAVNARNVTNVSISSGTAGNVSDFTGLVRLVPTGYAHSSGEKTMLLGRSVDGTQYYFSISDNASPGQLAGGFLKKVSLN